MLLSCYVAILLCAYHQPRSGMRAIGFTHGKGGVGKSTLALNVARALQLRGVSVAIVDCDAQATAGNWRGSHSDPAELPPVRRVTRAGDLPKALQELRQKGYQAAVVDGRAHLQAIHAAIVRAADLVLIPVQPSPADVWATADLVDVVKAAQERTGRPAAALVVSRRKPGTRLSDSVEAVLQRYGLPVLEGTADRVAYAEAMGQGLGVVEMSDAKAAAEIETLTDQITDLLSNA